MFRVLIEFLCNEDLSSKVLSFCHISNETEQLFQNSFFINLIFSSNDSDELIIENGLTQISILYTIILYYIE